MEVVADALPGRLVFLHGDEKKKIHLTYGLHLASPDLLVDGDPMHVQMVYAM